MWGFSNLGGTPGYEKLDNLLACFAGHLLRSSGLSIEHN